MNKRILSPEKLNEMVRVSKLRIWIILALLIVLIGGGLTLFLSNTIVSKEIHDCYVTSNTMTVEYFLAQKIKTSVDEDSEFMESIKRNNNAAFLNSYVQPAYIILKSVDETEMGPWMTAYIQKKKGFSYDISAMKVDYETIYAMTGMPKEELEKNNIIPGTSFYLATVLIPCDGPEPVIKSGYDTVSVILSEVDPISLILK